MKRVRILVAAVGAALATTAALVAPAQGATVPAPAPAPSSGAILVAPALDQRAKVKGEVFFTASVVVDTPTGAALLAGSADGRGSLWVDDQLFLQVQRPDGTRVDLPPTLFTGECGTGRVMRRPLALDKLLKPGRNIVHVAFRDTCGQDEGNSAVWIVGPGGTFTATVTTPRTPIKVPKLLPPINRSLQIRSVVWDSPGRDRRTNASINGEAVRLVNTSKKKQSLTGFTLRDRQGIVYRFPTTVVGPGKSLIVRTGKGRATGTVRYWGRTDHVWGNRGDTVILRDQYGRTTESVAWTKPGKGSATFR